MNDMTPARAGKYMHTFGGQKYWPMDPRPAEALIETIAHHLANQCRFNGATQHRKAEERMFYSVAEHSVYCSFVGPANEALERLLHDAAEAYIGDVIRPLKKLPQFEFFGKIEEINEAAIAERFQLTYPFPPSVKHADEAVCAAEVEQIITKDPTDEWESGLLHDRRVVAPIDIGCWTPYVAKTRFLRRFEDLWSKKHQRRREFDNRLCVIPAWAALGI